MQGMCLGRFESTPLCMNKNERIVKPKNSSKVPQSRQSKFWFLQVIHFITKYILILSATTKLTSWSGQKCYYNKTPIETQFWFHRDPGTNYTNNYTPSLFKSDRNFGLISSNSKWSVSDLSTILHMPRLLCRRGMCKICGEIWLLGMELWQNKHSIKLELPVKNPPWNGPQSVISGDQIFGLCVCTSASAWHLNQKALHSVNSLWQRNINIHHKLCVICSDNSLAAKILSPAWQWNPMRIFSCTEKLSVGQLCHTES